jgi:CxxC motif-containing protein
MSEQREYICVTCPVGCTIQAVVEGQELVELKGQACQRGEAFVREELTSPRRMLTTTVRVRGGHLPLVPVRSTAPLPQSLIVDIAALLREVELDAPVDEYQVVLAGALGTGVDIVTSRSMPAA